MSCLVLSYVGMLPTLRSGGVICHKLPFLVCRRLTNAPYMIWQYKQKHLHCLYYLCCSYSCVLVSVPVKYRFRSVTRLTPHILQGEMSLTKVYLHRTELKLRLPISGVEVEGCESPGVRRTLVEDSRGLRSENHDHRWSVCTSMVANWIKMRSQFMYKMVCHIISYFGRWPHDLDIRITCSHTASLCVTSSQM